MTNAGSLHDLDELCETLSHYLSEGDRLVYLLERSSPGGQLRKIRIQTIDDTTLAGEPMSLNGPDGREESVRYDLSDPEDRQKIEEIYREPISKDVLYPQTDNPF